jgi:glutamyl-Q tRNA(Asp) synthetase
MNRIDLSGLSSLGPLVTRFAPSPTGYLHLGHVVNAIYVWGIARAVGARVLLRLEDHDRVRCRPEYEDAILEDLDWLGFVPDAGRSPVLRQRDRTAAYDSALARLRSEHHVYTCRCSRRDTGGGPYPGTCRTEPLTDADSTALRVEIQPGTEEFDDLFLGRQLQEPARQCGDLLIRDRDGNWTYQFAVTVDDFEQGVNLVIRGTDLQTSTGRQIRLARMLGRPTPPVFAHHPLIRKASGEKLSKASRDAGVRDLRQAGLAPAAVIGLAGAAAGLTRGETPLPADAVSRFWDRI